MQFGIDRLAQDNFAILKGKRVGIFTNLSAVDHNLTPTYELFNRLDGIQLAALFTPEHGLGGAIHDGVAISSTVDSKTGIPIHSLYGDTLAPTAEMLTGLDVMVCDIQDIGVRYYTFLWTLSYILEACGEHHVPVMILDRPNPIGDQIDGGTLAPHLASLVGRFPIPIQHGMTIGELAKMINANWNLYPAELEVIACIGLHRGMQWPKTGRPFVPPSPNMPHFTTALHYPGACLIEGTNLSEGRGTALPFEIVGAPFIDSISLADKLNMTGLPGAVPRPHQFIPGTSKFTGKTCGGVQIHITEPSQYRPLETWLTVLQTIREMYPGEFNWLPPSGDLQHFDRLIGDEKVRATIDSGDSLDRFMAEWSSFQEQFRQQRARYLIYGEVDGF
jgi:uncharacterized protein YbbC (DUF1343 family)